MIFNLEIFRPFNRCYVQIESDLRTKDISGTIEHDLEGHRWITFTHLGKRYHIIHKKEAGYQDRLKWNKPYFRYKSGDAFTTDWQTGQSLGAGDDTSDYVQSRVGLDVVRAHRTGLTISPVVILIIIGLAVAGFFLFRGGFGGTSTPSNPIAPPINYIPTSYVEVFY